MILFKKWARHKVKPYIYCVNQFFREKCHKKWNQECKRKQSLLFNFCNIFHLLSSRTQKIAWWAPVFKTYFYIFSYNEQLSSTIFLLYHTSLNNKVMHLFKVTRTLWSLHTALICVAAPVNRFRNRYFDICTNISFLPIYLRT